MFRKIILSIVNRLPERNDVKLFLEHFFQKKKYSKIALFSVLINFLISFFDNIEKFSQWVFGYRLIKFETIKNNIGNLLLVSIVLFLFLSLVSLFLSFVKKWNEAIKKNRMLSDFSQYHSRITQSFIIQLSHIQKSKKTFIDIAERLHRYYEKFEETINDIDATEGKLYNKNIHTRKKSDQLKLLEDFIDLVGETSIDLYSNTQLLSDQIISAFDKTICKGFKRFLKDIISKNIKAIEIVAQSNVSACLYLYKNDVRTSSKVNYIYVAFVDDNLFYEEGNRNRNNLLDFASTEFYGLTTEKQRFLRNNSLIVELKSDNISNGVNDTYGYLKFNFSEYIKSKEKVIDEQALLHIISPMNLVISELISYNMNQMCEAMASIRQQVPSTKTSEFDFLETIHKNICTEVENGS